MDTYRVKLPQPQPVADEEEFVTSSGRRVKRPIVNHASTIEDVELQLSGRDGEDMLGSGLSVLSPGPGDATSARDGQLTNSMQATLHLSLDRLSENYDPEDYKRLKEKSANSRMALTTEREKKLARQIILPADEGSGGDSGHSQKGEPGLISQDSLDVYEMEPAAFVPQLDSEHSEEFVVSDEEDGEQTAVVQDSLNFSTSRDDTTPTSHDSETKSRASRRTPTNSYLPSHKDDKYADLRYNPNWRQTKTQRSEPSPMVIDFKAAPKLEDSLEEPLISQRGGGAIVVHKKEFYSPAAPDWGKESFPIFSSGSISPTRLSTDPVRLQQTNAKYEEEFNRMLKAEILTDADMHEPDNFQQENLLGNIHRLPEQISSPRKASYSVLIRKLDSENRPSFDEPPRAGGYQLLPDRHRIPSPPSVVSASKGVRTIRKQQSHQRTPLKHPNGQDGYRSPETYYYPGKKDPLVALSPREKSKHPIVPTPPKMPKPKDYVELNKQRLGRKTSSAGYLDIHRKKSRQADQLKSRSQSDIRGTVSQETYSTQATSPQQMEYENGTVESIWTQQTERLKVAKGQNVNKGKVIRRSQNPRQNGPAHGATFLVTPNTHNQYWEGMPENAVMNGNDWHHYNPGANIDAGQQHRLHQQNRNTYFRTPHPLPIPSQVLQQDDRMVLPGNEELMDSRNDSSLRKTYASPRTNSDGDQESPLMKAYRSKYTTDVFEPTTYPNRGFALQQNFSEQNLALPQRRTISDQPDVWTNMEGENEFSPGTLPPSGYSNVRPIRKVTFFGDSEPIAIEGISSGDPVPSPPLNAVYQLNKYKLPLPPTPPSKSQRHTVHKGRRFSEEKENEGYYDVRQDNFSILPPILKSHQKMSPRKLSSNGAESDSPKHENKGSYLAQHEKQKKKFQYKIYTLNDYKNLKKDVKLGGLGPDLESAREKMGNAEKARKYAEMVRKEHMTNATVIKPKEDENETGIHDKNYHFSATMDEKQRGDMLEKRKRAIEYSKRIPKPKPAPSPQSNMDKPSTISTYSSELPSSDNPEAIDFDWGLLQMLKDRHEKEKAQVAAFSGNS